MTPTDLETYLYEHIPLSHAMEARVIQTSPSVVLSAPLAPNINHASTVFGGSSATLATLAAWSLVRVQLDSIPHELVVRRGEIDYVAPGTGDFVATTEEIPAEEWDRVWAAMKRGKSARLVVRSVVESNGVVIARYEGEFVARPRRTEPACAPALMS